MFNARSGLLLAGLAFGIWETVDIFWISSPAVAAVMAVLWFACTLWYWRRDSLWAAGALLVLFAFEGAVAPSLKAETVTKAFDVALAVAGIVLGLIVIVSRRRGRESRAVGSSG